MELRLNSPSKKSLSRFSDFVYGKLRRKTVSTDFMPQVDGIRFLAIMSVIMAHLMVFVALKTSHIFTEGGLDTFLYNLITGCAHKGVLLFFVVSGFILGLPFAKKYTETLSVKKVSLKSYFLRRITRIEPPYIINTIAFTILLTFFAKHEYAQMFVDESLSRHFLASILYLHNIFYPHSLAINSVTWSLEVEVQFYVLAPLLALLFKLSTKLRRVSIIFLILLFSLVQNMYSPEFLSIYNFIHYFLVGFLLVDFYLSNSTLPLPKSLDMLFGVLSLSAYTFITFNKYGNNSIQEILMVVILFSIGFIVLQGNFWKRIFSIRFFTAVGGMCYTAYLWHMAIISGIGNISIKLFTTKYFLLNVMIQMLWLLPAVLLTTIVLYLLIEKPCMDKNWPSKLVLCIRRIFQFSIKTFIKGAV